MMTGLVERVLITLPHAQRISASTYFGCISAFIKGPTSSHLVEGWQAQKTASALLAVPLSRSVWSASSLLALLRAGGWVQGGNKLHALRTLHEVRSPRSYRAERIQTGTATKFRRPLHSLELVRINSIMWNHVLRHKIRLTLAERKRARKINLRGLRLVTGVENLASAKI